MIGSAHPADQGDGAPHTRVYLVGIITLAVIARFVRLGSLSLLGDESYYWLWSRHPAWAYYDHPAGIALLVRASTALGGTSAFGVRWLNAATGVACVILVYLVGKRLLSRRAGLFAAASVTVASPYLITSRFVYTNALTLLLILLNLLTFWRMTREDAGVPEGLAFGLTLALLYNTKYSAYPYTVALAVAVLLDHRPLLRTRRFWTAALVGALGLMPVVLWNADHEWASFRWQLSHLTRGAVQHASVLGRAGHAWAYLTGPLIVLAALGLWRVRTAAERLLTCVALFLLVPVAVSPINSPRNLSSGLIPLLLLAGTRLPPNLTTWPRRAVAGALASLLLGSAVFGVGTVVNLWGPSPLPQSSIVPAIRRDAAGWRVLGEILEGSEQPILALDYSIAGQIHFYADRPAYAAWGQYRIWGIPPLQDATVVALDYVDPAVVTQRLQTAYRHLEGPERFAFTEWDATKVVYVWRARGLRWDQKVLLRRLDFLTLIEESR